MSVVSNVRAVENVFKSLDKEMSKFQEKSGIKCLNACFHCCTKPDIHATKLEFLPLAYHLYTTGKAEEMLTKIESNESYGLCPVFNPFKINEERTTGCSQYAHRGLICRLFGYSFNTDKNGKPVLATCSIIKKNYPEQVKNATENENIKKIFYANYYNKLLHISSYDAVRLVPISQAIKEAIEWVLFFSSFRKKRA